MAALVREGVDEVLRDDGDALGRRVEAIDQLQSMGARGPADLGRHHDAYLDEW